MYLDAEVAIKGIAAVGPTLDVYGQIIGVVQISGTMSVGARYTFDKAEVYWPQDSDSTDYSKINDLIGDPQPVQTGIERAGECGPRYTRYS